MEERKDGFRTLRLLYGMIQFLYWAGGSVALGFAVAFLQELGFDNARAGLVSAFASLLGGLMMLAVSRRIDRCGAGAVYRWSRLLVLAQCLVLGGILLLREQAFAALLFYTLYLALTLTLSSPVAKLYIDLKRGGVPIRFGIARGFGSLGYALTSLSAGFLLARFHPCVLLPAGQGLFLLMGLLLLPLRKLLLLPHRSCPAHLFLPELPSWQRLPALTLPWLWAPAPRAESSSGMCRSSSIPV